MKAFFDWLKGLFGKKKEISDIRPKLGGPGPRRRSPPPPPGE